MMISLPIYVSHQWLHLATIGAILYGYGTYAYFMIIENRVERSHPYVEIKLIFSLSILFLAFSLYDFTDRSIIYVCAVSIGSFLSIFYFRRYLEVVPIEGLITDINSLEESLESSDNKERAVDLARNTNYSFIKGLWAIIAGAPFIYAITFRYLIFAGFISPSEVVLFASDLGFYWPIFIISLYFFSAYHLKTPSSEEFRLLRLYRYAEPSPQKSNPEILKTTKAYIRSIGGKYAIRSLRIIKEEDPQKEMTPWETEYKEHASDAFFYYAIVAYLWPIAWRLLDVLPTLYTIVPPYNLGLYGLGLIFTGSLFLALEPLTDIPDVGDLKGPKLVVGAHLGFLLLATGTLYQISSEIGSSELVTNFERESYLLFYSESELETMFLIAEFIAPLVTIPLIFIIFLKTNEKSHKN